MLDNDHRPRRRSPQRYWFATAAIVLTLAWTKACTPVPPEWRESPPYRLHRDKRPIDPVRWWGYLVSRTDSSRARQMPGGGRIH